MLRWLRKKSIIKLQLLSQHYKRLESEDGMGSVDNFPLNDMLNNLLYENDDSIWMKYYAVQSTS